MPFQRIVKRVLPSGSAANLFPFHISMEGLESTLLCREEDDYDVLQKYYHISCWKADVLVIEEIEMSNHGHLAVLAANYERAVAAAGAIKKNYSQYLAHKYGQKGTLSRSDILVQYLDSDWYTRNALAYIARNALDAGCSIEDYGWSSYRAYFRQKDVAGIPVSQMTKREREGVFRTHADLSGVPWLVDNKGHLIPSSTCDYKYLEDAFNNDQAFFLKAIGTVNPAEMHLKLVYNPRVRQNDTELCRSMNDILSRWWNCPDIVVLSMEKKTRLIPYLYNTHNTTVAQLARCVQLDKSRVEAILKQSHCRNIK